MSENESTPKFFHEEQLYGVKKDSRSIVEVNGRGVLLIFDKEYLHPWDSIHSLRRFGADWMRTAGDIGTVAYRAQGEPMISGGKGYAYQIQTVDGKFYPFEVADREGFEAGLKKAEKIALLDVPEMFVPNSLLLALGALVGATFFFNADYFGRNDVLVRLGMMGIGVLICGICLYFLSKYHL